MMVFIAGFWTEWGAEECYSEVDVWRRGIFSRSRRCSNCRHYQLHQYQQPFCYARSRCVMCHVQAIAAITSCTNTSNPSVMLGAGTWHVSLWKLSVDQEELIKFWKSSTSGSRSRNFSKDSSRLQYRTFLHNLTRTYGKLTRFSCRFITDVRIFALNFRSHRIDCRVVRDLPWWRSALSRIH